MPDGIVEMRRLIPDNIVLALNNIDLAIQRGAAKGVGACPSTRSRVTHAFYLLLREYCLATTKDDVKRIYKRFKEMLEGMEGHG